MSTPNPNTINDAKNVQFIMPAAGTPAAEALAANAAIKVTKVAKGLHKIRGMKRPKMKSFNVVKQINKLTKKKRKKRHFSRNIKGKVIDGVNELYTLTAGIMLGIRVAINYTAVHANDPLTIEDFSFVQKLTCPAAGSNKGLYVTPPHALVHTFKFKSYAPKVFGRIREFFAIPSVSYMLSICGNYNYLEFISNSKSGQFFFYSHDGKYMIKTQTKEENKFMKRILPHYYKYVSENPNTLLVRILAMHRVKMYHLRRKVHFVIMSSVFDTPEEIHSIYDLKGSLIGRHATEKEKASGGVLKDLDLLESKTKFKLGSKKGKFIEQLRKDAMFLASLNIMDYSLLVGTHDRSKRVYAEDLKDDSSLSASMSHSAHDHPIIGSNTPFRRQSLLHVAQPPAIGSNENSNSMAGANPTEQSMGIAIPASAGSPRRRSMSRDRVRTTSKCENDSKDSPRQADPALSPGGASTSGGDGSIGIHTNEIELTECEEEDAEDEEDSEEEPDDVSYVSDEGDSDLEADLALQSQELPLEEMPFSPTQLQALEKKKRQSFEEESHFHRNSSARSSEGKFLTSPPSSGSIEAMGVDRILGDEVTQSPSPHTVPSPQQQNVEDNGVETFGLGATKLHPWTSRVDGGINSRLKDGTRGNEIYYMGVIDILQQYNTSKMIESLFKGIYQDRNKISSVDANTYAKRFIKFMEDNIE